MWYVIHLFVDLDKFLTRYQTLSGSVRSAVTELITFRLPHKTMYQRDLGMFVGYVFMQVDPTQIARVHKDLKAASLGEVLTSPGSRYLMPLGAEEVEWIYKLLQSPTDEHLQQGHSVRITEGPFEGMTGTVESVAGQKVSVRVPLRRSVTIAECTADTLEAV